PVDDRVVDWLPLPDVFRLPVDDHFVAVPRLDRREELLRAGVPERDVARAALRPGLGIALRELGLRPFAVREPVQVDAHESGAQERLTLLTLPGHRLDAVQKSGKGIAQHFAFPVGPAIEVDRDWR